MKIRFAVSLGAGNPDPDQLASALGNAESIGFDSVWFSDLPVVAGVDPMQAVAFAAGISRRLHLGVNVVPFGYQPFVFANRLAQLDRLTSGRLLVTLVPGLDRPGERAALGIAGQHRARLMERLVPDLKAWWSGEPAGPAGLRLPARPLQDPLEVWLGGRTPAAARRVGTLAEGWLGSQLTPAEAGAFRRRVQEEAKAADRVVDPEHFGLSVAYAREAADLERAEVVRQPRAAEVVPVGAAALRTFVGRLVDEGLSKFVLRPVAGAGQGGDLEWLAGTVFDLQT